MRYRGYSFYGHSYSTTICHTDKHVEFSYKSTFALLYVGANQNCSYSITVSVIATSG